MTQRKRFPGDVCIPMLFGTYFLWANLVGRGIGFGTLYQGFPVAFFVDTDFGIQSFSWKILALDALIGLVATVSLVRVALRHDSFLRTGFLAILILFAANLGSSGLYGGLPLAYSEHCWLGPACNDSGWRDLVIDTVLSFVLIQLAMRYIATPRKYITGIAATLVVWATVTPWNHWYKWTTFPNGVGFPFGFYWNSLGGSFLIDVTLGVATVLLIDFGAKAAFPSSNPE